MTYIIINIQNQFSPALYLLHALYVLLHLHLVQYRTVGKTYTTVLYSIYFSVNICRAKEHLEMRHILVCQHSEPAGTIPVYFGTRREG